MLSFRLLPAIALWLGLAAGSPALAQEVGVTAAVNQNSTGTPPSQKPRTMVLGDRIIHNEKIDTDSRGLLQILLADGTSFTVGPSSSMSIDSFVYDPDAGTAKVVATLGKGMFRFIGGKTSKTPDGATINTPVGTVGIRGGIGDFDFRHLHGIPFHIDMLFGNSITLTSGGQQLGRIYQAGYSLVIGGNGQAGVQKTPAGWTQSFQQAITSLPGQHGGTAHGAGATTTAVANAVNTVTGGNHTAPPPVTTPNLVAGAGGLPGTVTLPPVTLPEQPGAGGGNTTWAQINNSSLADAWALYSGQYQVTVTRADNLPSNVFLGQDNQVPAVGSSYRGDFGLVYSFASHDDVGLAFFSAPGQTFNGSGVLGVPVSASHPDHSGPADFVGQFDQPGYAAPGLYSQPTAHVQVQGGFQNTLPDVASGVQGTVAVQIRDIPNVNDVVVPNSALDANGTFGGTRIYSSTTGNCGCTP